jgi:hypothetical protein
MVIHHMSAEGVGKFIERAVHTLLPGYARARDLEGAPDVARGKLNLARQADPSCPGLDDALAELEHAARPSP